jgi:hypothetical protein
VRAVASLRHRALELSHTSSVLQASLARARRPVSIAGLAAFRIAFGLVMCAACVRFIAKGWVDRFFVEPSFHFTYPAFEFVRPWSSGAMHAHYVLLVIFALGIALGFCYRLASAGFFLGFTYVELIDKAVYLNHYYLVSLLSGLLMLLPAGRAYSLDAVFFPTERCSTVPAWVPWALRLQVGLVYFFAGVAKLNHDWLIEAQPLRIWLAARSDWPLLGPWLAEPAVAYVASWSSALFDLTIPFWLLQRRTRRAAFAAVVGFHAFTGLSFPIGIFPWLMSASATLFFAHDWPSRWLGDRTARRDSSAWSPPRWLAPLLAAHCVTQVLIPASRHLDRESAWTLQDFNFAWKVMVAEKAGQVRFRVRDRTTGATRFVEPREFLAPFQEASMALDPEMVRQAARFLRARHEAEGRDVAVYADAIASLNGRPARALIDPAVDLTRALPNTWILPLE